MVAINLKGKTAFVAGVGDDQGFGWAIAKALRESGADVIIGVWTPMLKIFTMALESGKFDESRKLQNGGMLEFAGIYPMDAVFDAPEDVPEDIKENKRYKEVSSYTISEMVEKVKRDGFSHIDMLVHALANAPEVKKQLMDTSRKGYLSAMSSSTYSFISLLSHFAPMMPQGSSVLSLTYIASTSVIPGYGGGMSSAKAALESDIRTLAFEAGRRYGIRVNAISAGPYASRAAKAIGFIDKMITYNENNSPLNKSIEADDVANTALFLLSGLGKGVTGAIIPVDCGMNIMGAALDSLSLQTVE